MGTGLFWAIVVALSAVVAVIFLQAMRRGMPEAAEHPDLKVYRDQLAEVDRDMARGVLSPEEGARLRTEVSRRLIEADRALQAATVAPPRGGLWLGGGLALALVAAGPLVYRELGVPGYPDLPVADRLAMAEDIYRNRPTQAEAMAAVPATPPAEVDPEFAALMDKLRATVETRPDDPMGLDLLARNEAGLGNFAAAIAAQEKLIAVLGDKAAPGHFTDLARFMVAGAGGIVTPEAEAQLVAALSRDPKDGMARYLSGLMMAQVGRPDRAFDLWQPLLEEGPAGAPWVEAVRADIERVAEAAGIRYSLPEASQPGGPSAEDMAAAAGMSEEDRQAMIAGMVDQLETRLKDEGGPVEEWIRLLNALGVLNQPDRARAALVAAETALAGDAAALEQVRAAAQAAGLAP